MFKISALAAFVAAALAGCGGGGGSAPSTHIVNIIRTTMQLRWSDADTYCRTTMLSGQTGWRLPTQEELAAYAKMGADIGGGAAWSSTPAQPTFHYYVSLNSTTGAAIAAEDASYFHVRCAHD